MARRINPFTDFGFKYIFGRESSKENLIDFLNGLLKNEPGFEPIMDITYTDKENKGSGPLDRGIIYDINCVTATGRQFIVEMQNSQQEFFFDRSIYYVCRALCEQGERGQDWRYDLKPVYIIAFVNFNIPELGDRVRSDVGLCNLMTNEPISDKMRFIFIQLPKFRDKREEDCKDIFEWWIYNLINMETMEQLAFIKQHHLFQRLSEITEYAALNKEQRKVYDADLKAYRDLTNSIEFAESKGRQEGEISERSKIISTLFSNGMKPDSIARMTGIPESEVTKILFQ